MLLLRTVLIIILISFLQCCAHSLTSSNEISPSIEKLTVDLENKSISKICDQTGFNVGGYFLNKIDKPIIVRKIKGRLVPINDNSWPDKSRPLFQIRAFGKGTIIMSVMGDINGKFVMDDVLEGQYCFHASCYGWNDYAGIIIVDKRADSKNEILIEMETAS